MLDLDLDTIVAFENEVQLHPWPRSAFEQALRLKQHCPVYEENNVILAYGCADGGHGRTIAAKTMKAAGYIYREWFAHARAVGAPILWAEVEPGNAAARLRLERFGFQQVGERPGFYGPGLPALAYQKRTEDTAAVQDGESA